MEIAETSLRCDMKDKLWIKAMEFGANVWGCHQIPERSFFICGYQMPICARCTGILIGELVMLFSIIPPISILHSILLSIPMLIDGSVQKITHYRSTNVRRFITGFLFGLSYICLLKTLLARIKSSMSSPNS